MLTKRKVSIKGPIEPCERGCGQEVALTVREDDGAKRVSTIDNGRVMPGGYNVTCRPKR